MKKPQDQPLENPEEIRALTEDEMQEVLNKYDRETSTRIFSGKKQVIIKWLLIAFTVFALIINTVWRLPVQQHRAIFLAAVLFLVYLLYPAAQVMHKKNNKIPLDDIALAFISSGLSSLACMPSITASRSGVILSGNHPAFSGSSPAAASLDFEGSKNSSSEPVIW